MSQNDESPELGSFFLGRQPILNEAREIVAFELLFRAGNTLSADITNDLTATSAVIVNSAQMGLQQVLSQHDGYINVARDLLMSDLIELLPRDCTVLEILETVVMDEEVLQRCRELKDKGFRLALDDFEYAPVYDELLELVDIVKLDMLLLNPAQVEEHLQLLQAWPHLRLLAEKVEDMATYQRCRDWGFGMFQGYFFAHPTVLSGRKASPNQMALMRAMHQLLGDAEVKEIEQTFKASPALAIGLLRLVNSVSMGLSQEISSLKQALVMLGRKQLQRWVQLLLYAQENCSASDNPLLQMVALRAKLMEQLIWHYPDRAYSNELSRDKAFMVGMLSKVDVVMGIPLDAVLNEMGVSDEVADAILTHAGIHGQLLMLAEQLEQGDFAAVATSLEALQLNAEILTQSQREALEWVSNLGVEAHH